MRKKNIVMSSFCSKDTSSFTDGIVNDLSGTQVLFEIDLLSLANLTLPTLT